jgi:hypothetical protein
MCVSVYMRVNMCFCLYVCLSATTTFVAIYPALRSTPFRFTNRVTRLGEFSPVWAFVFFGQFFWKLQKYVKLLAYFLCNTSLLILTKKGLDYILGDFSRNSSGHPASFLRLSFNLCQFLATRVARSLCNTKHTKTGKNIPKDLKLHQMAIHCIEWPKITHTKWP